MFLIPSQSVNNTGGQVFAVLFNGLTAIDLPAGVQHLFACNQAVRGVLVDCEQVLINEIAVACSSTGEPVTLINGARVETTPQQEILRAIQNLIPLAIYSPLPAGAVPLVLAEGSREVIRYGLRCRLAIKTLAEFPSFQAYASFARALDGVFGSIPPPNGESNLPSAVLAREAARMPVEPPLWLPVFVFEQPAVLSLTEPLGQDLYRADLYTFSLPAPLEPGVRLTQSIRWTERGVPRRADGLLGTVERVEVVKLL